MPRFRAGLSVLGILPPDEVISLLRHRLGLLEAQLAGERGTLAHHARTVPRLFLIEAEYDLAVRAAEAAWLRGLLDELTSGSFPDLAQWRDAHDTGRWTDDTDRRSAT